MRSVRQYEIMIILDPNQDERTVAPSLDKFLDVVRKENGAVEKVDIWPKRKLSYPINKQEEGIYAVRLLADIWCCVANFRNPKRDSAERSSNSRW